MDTCLILAKAELSARLRLKEPCTHIPNHTVDLDFVPAADIFKKLDNRSGRIFSNDVVAVIWIAADVAGTFHGQINRLIRSFCSGFCRSLCFRLCFCLDYDRFGLYRGRSLRCHGSIGRCCCLGGSSGRICLSCRVRSLTAGCICSRRRCFRL